MENTVSVKARFTSSTTKGSTVLQFELDSDCKNDGTAGKLLAMVRHMVTLEITDEQMMLNLDADEQADEAEQIVPVILELPESYVEEVEDEEA